MLTKYNIKYAAPFRKGAQTYHYQTDDPVAADQFLGVLQFTPLSSTAFGLAFFIFGRRKVNRYVFRHKPEALMEQVES